MSTATSSATPTSTAKAQRQLFGVTGQPIRAVRVLSKPMAFDHKATEARSWIIVTPEGTIIRANSYNGGLGRNFDPNAAGVSHPLPSDEKAQKKAFKGYEDVQGNALPGFVTLVTA